MAFLACSLRSLRSFLFLIPLLASLACTKKEVPESSVAGAAKTEGSGLTIGLVLDKGGKDDKSFNSAAFRGSEKAALEFGLQLKTVESPDSNAFEPALTTMAQRGTPLVIAIGFSQKDAVTKVAAQFPKIHFALVDAQVDLPNVQSLLFAEHEGSYLVGYAAGLASKSGTVGFVGGMDVALIRRFQVGYEAGLKAARKDGKVLVNYVGVTGEAWSNPNRGKEIALDQVRKGADVIYTAAGATNMGVFDAVEEKKILAIGVDSNQNFIKPGKILTSMLKQVDVAVYEAIAAEVKGTFKGGRRDFSLRDKGVDYSVDEHNKTLIAPYQEKLEAERAKILSGEVVVPDYYLMRK
jgi:basic membrane protein A